MSEDFEALPRALQIHVDEAFDAAVKSKHSIGSSRIGQTHPPAVANSESAGGFIIESDDRRDGFAPTETSDGRPSDDDLIAISLIPSALQYLDLPPDDEDVLKVFRNAAGGWSAATRTDGSDIGDEERGGTVSRKDWRAVCAVIIGGHESEDAAGGFLIDGENSPVQGNSICEGFEGEDGEDGDNEDEAYQASSLNSSLSTRYVSDTDSDEYLAEPSSAKTKTKTSDRKPKQTPVAISHATPTPRQKQASLDAFALFFPSSPSLSDNDLATKRIMFKDIARVAGLLKEKIKAEEVCAFFTSTST